MTDVRSTAQRIADTIAKLETEEDAWVASASRDGAAYLIPLSYYWDGERLTLATPIRSRTARNLRRTGRARLALGPTRDVVIIEGALEELDVMSDDRLAAAHAAATGFDARVQNPPYCFFRLAPDRIQAWRSPAELEDRDVMHDGSWLA
jgi:hypothetical protein